jgi:hypothetical protein
VKAAWRKSLQSKMLRNLSLYRDRYVFNLWDDQ